MLTETNYHHHNTPSTIPSCRNHYAPYPTKSSTDFQLAKFDFHQAVRNNDASGLLHFHARLRQHPSAADTVLLNSDGQTPLYTAIAHNRLSMVDFLLHLGHNPYCISVSRESALYVAIGFGRLEIVEYLLNRGFPVDYLGVENKTPLERAIECNQGSIVVTLLKHGTDWRRFEKRRQNGEKSLVEWAVDHQHPQVLGVLIDLYGDDESIFNQIGMM